MKKGSHVVCIDDSIEPHKLEEISKDFQQWVTKGEHYIIREIYDNDDIVIGILLEEIHNKKLFMGIINRVQEPAFAMWRFRELLPHEIEVNEIEMVLDL